MKEWTLGFIFSEDLQRVVLLKKSQTMHIGLWNGVGGKIEGKETSIACMIRECKEETKLGITDWAFVGRLEADGGRQLAWCVYIYAAVIPDNGLVDITKDWITNPEINLPFQVSLDNISQMPLAPHTEPLIYFAKAKLKNPSARPVIIREWD